LDRHVTVRQNPERDEQGRHDVTKRRPLLSLLLMVSMMLLAACAQHIHHYYGVAAMPAINGELQWDRTGSTANGTLTLGGGSEPRTGLPPGTYRLAITFTADTFAGVVSDTGGKEVAKATGTVTATGVDLTVTTPETAPFMISFKSTQPGIYTHSPEY
jgi:hypothetical protein